VAAHTHPSHGREPGYAWPRPRPRRRAPLPLLLRLRPPRFGEAAPAGSDKAAGPPAFALLRADRADCALIEEAVLFSS